MKWREALEMRKNDPFIFWLSIALVASASVPGFIIALSDPLLGVSWLVVGQLGLLFGLATLNLLLEAAIKLRTQRREER